MVLRQVIPDQAGLPTRESTSAYWHKEPSQRLLGHRTTTELPVEADVVVIGSGITGAFAAHFLKRHRTAGSVVMLEAREACWGATGRNGGHCQPMVFASPPDITAFELRTFRFVRDLVRDHDIPCDWVSLSGVSSFGSQDLFDLAAATVTRLKERHPELAREVEVVFPQAQGKHEDEENGPEASSYVGDSDGVAERQGQPRRPTLASLRVPNAKGAVVQRNAASLWPYKLVVWLLEALLRDFPAPAFNLQTWTPVTGIKRREKGEAGLSLSSSSSSSSPNITSHTRPWVVTTPRGSISATKVLVCANGYTSRIVPSFADLIVPVRGQVAALLPPLAPSTQVPVQLTHSYNFAARATAARSSSAATGGGDGPDHEDYLVQRPLPGAELILGGQRFRAAGYAVGEWRDDVVEVTVAKGLRRALSGVLDLAPSPASSPASSPPAAGVTERHSDVKELPATFEWTGIMGYSRDGLPWVGRVPESMGGGGGSADHDDEEGGLWLCAGYTGHGMPRAPMCAEAVVEMMMGGVVGKEEVGTKRAGGGPHRVQLPESFLLTEERVERVRRSRVSVFEQEEHGGVDFTLRMG